MKLKVTAILEMTQDGLFSCSVTENLGNYGIAGYGKSADEAKEDMLACYEEMKEINAEEGVETPELEFTYKYDMQAFFDKFSFFNITKLATEAGINESQMRRYARGLSKASDIQYRKLSIAINRIKEELSSVTL